MEARDVQNLNLPLGFSEPQLHTAVECNTFGESIHTPRIRHSDSQRPNLLSCNYFYPLCNQVRL